MSAERDVRPAYDVGESVPEVAPAQFRQVLGHYPTGVVVVTALGEAGRPVGMVIGSFTSVSLSPPLVAFLPSKSSATYASMRSAASVVVNVLAAEQESLCRRFGSRSVDKFDGVGWRPAASGAPVLDGVVAWIDCDVEDVLDAGDHDIVLCRVRELDVASPAVPLLFFQGGYGGFAASSLTAGTEADLVDLLYLADLARPHMERLAAEVRLECTASCRVGNEYVALAGVGASASGRAQTRVGRRLPLVPPIGMSIMAISPPAELDAWLARLGPDRPAAVEAVRAALAAVRRRGWSFGTRQDYPDDLMELSDRSRPPAWRLAQPVLRQHLDRLAGAERQDLAAAAAEGLHHLSVPVLDRDGRAALGLALLDLPAMSVAEVGAVADRLLATAAQVTADIVAATSP